MSPRSSEQFKELRDASRQKILDASLELFGTKGYESTTISDIVKSAGISKGLIYHYFESKEDILKNLIDELMSRGDESMGSLFLGDAKDSLRKIFELFFKEMRENYNMWALILKLTVQVNHFQFIHDLARQKMQAYVQIMEGLFKELGYKNPNLEARLLGALFDGIGMQYYVLNEPSYLDEMEKILYNKYDLI